MSPRGLGPGWRSGQRIEARKRFEACPEQKLLEVWRVASGLSPALRGGTVLVVS